MSKIADVIKKRSEENNRSRTESREEIAEIRMLSVYAGRLQEEFKHKVDTILDDESVRFIEIEVPENQLSMFLKVIYREEFFVYDIVQTEENIFEVGLKEIIL